MAVTQPIKNHSPSMEMDIVLQAFRLRYSAQCNTHHLESWILSTLVIVIGDFQRFERVFIPELLWIHLCEMACSIGRSRVFF